MSPFLSLEVQNKKNSFPIQHDLISEKTSCLGLCNVSVGILGRTLDLRGREGNAIAGKGARTLPRMRARPCPCSRAPSSPPSATKTIARRTSINLLRVTTHNHNHNGRSGKPPTTLLLCNRSGGGRVSAALENALGSYKYCSFSEIMMHSNIARIETILLIGTSISILGVLLVLWPLGTNLFVVRSGDLRG